MSLEALLAHFVGDYVLQSDWMAEEKTTRWLPALTYALPFLLLTQSLWTLLVIGGTHVVIDRWRLTRHLVWLTNFLAPPGWHRPWRECSENRLPAGQTSRICERAVAHHRQHAARGPQCRRPDLARLKRERR